MDEQRLTARGVAALRAGDRAGARALLVAAVRADPADAAAWLWLSGALDDPAAQRDCLERALALDPGCEPARAGLAALAGGRETVGAEEWEVGRQGGRETVGAEEREVGRQGDRETGGAGEREVGRQGDTETVGAGERAVARVPWAPWGFAALAGVGAALGWAAWRGLGIELGGAELLALAVAAGAPGGLVALLLLGVLLRVGGRLLGGRAGAAEVRGALGRAVAPAAAGLGLWIAQLALLPVSFDGPPHGADLVVACWAAHAALWAWSAARSVGGLAEAHGLPTWRAAAAWLIAALALAGGALALVGGAALVIGLRGG